MQNEVYRYVSEGVWFSHTPLTPLFNLRLQASSSGFFQYLPGGSDSKS